MRTISSYSGAHHRQEARSPKDRYQDEHCRLPDKVAPRLSLQCIKETDGTTTSYKK